ncbi:hypothetical protein GCM10025868_19150 [Angustibacter aerolatus]|uniref:Tetratricopeptide repeat protein n=1 Tax=Angustibacter aerolatus TaxID=1162965 RepID=A0ABQ6JIL1_9ACTN|nr:hypothetical protein [Angustibacter aerolatus]GMA86665.1 hypothetical protein GCM10025868_19150 [Angustibacter aerolatus]
MVERHLGDAAAAEQHLAEAVRFAPSFLRRARSNVAQNAPVYEGFAAVLDEIERRVAADAG